MKDLKFKLIAQGFDKASKPFKNIVKTSASMQKSLGKTAKELKALNDTQKRLKGFEKLGRDTLQTNRALSQAQKEAQRLARAYKSAERPTKQMARAAQTAAKQVQKLKQRQRAQSQELHASRNVLRQNGVNVKRLGQEQGKVASKIASTNRRLEQQQRALRRATEQQNKLRRAGERYRKTLATQSNVAFVGAAGLASGGTALRGLGRTLSPGMSFDEQMSAVGAIARVERSSKAFADLRSQALLLGATTQFSATEAASGMEFLAMAGFEAVEIISAMPGLLDLAKAGRAELAQTADIASNILSAFKLDPARMGELGDTLTATFTRSNVSLTQLGETMTYVAPVANQVGASMQEAAAMAGLLGNVGIQASMAGTQMRALYTRLASPPSEAAKALKALAIRTTDATGNLRSIPSILAEVAQKTERLGNAQRLGFFTDIAGLRAGTGMAELVGQGGAGEIQRFTEILNNAGGEAARVAKEMGNNAAGDLKSFMSAWEGLNIALSDTQTVGLRGIIQGFTGIVRSATAWVRENPKLAGTLFTLAAGMAAVWAVIGGLAIAVAGILGPFAIAKFAMAAVGLKAMALVPIMGKVAVAIGLVGKALLLNPIGLAITAIAAAAFLVWKYWDPISSFFTSLWSNVKATFAGGIGSITAAIVNWSPLGLFYRSFAGLLSWFGVELPGTFTELGSALIDGLINGVTSRVSTALETVRALGAGMRDTFKGLLGIQSPSRVFARLGGFVTDGLAQGVTGGQRRALAAVASVGRSLPRAVTAGALAATVATVPAYAGPGEQNVAGARHVEIHIHPPTGTDPLEIARLVKQALEEHEQEADASARSSLFDRR